MIYVYIVIILSISVGAILFFPVYALITAMILNVPIPSDMGGDWLNFITAIRNWYLVLIVIIPLLVYVFVQTQKPKAVIIER
jgi:hypothetical protein